MATFLKKLPGLIASIAILASFQWLGILATEALNLPLPGPVAGLVFLFVILLATGRLPDWFSESCSRVIGLLSLFFLPAGAGIFFLGDLFRDQWLPILLAILVATPISIAITALLMAALFKRVESSD